MKKEKRTHVMLWSDIRLLFLAAVCFIISFILNQNEWISNVFVSIATGCLTGFIVYLLANKRTGIQTILRDELDQLKALQIKVRSAYYDVSYYSKDGHLSLEDDPDNICMEILKSAQAVFEELLEFSPEILNELGYTIPEAIENGELADFNAEINAYKRITDIYEDNGIKQAERILSTVSIRLGDIEKRLGKPIYQKRKRLSEFNHSFL